MSNEITPGIERAYRARADFMRGEPIDDANWAALQSRSEREGIRAALAAALDGPKDQYDCMDDVTIAVHGAICESGPEECVEWRGPCVKAMEAARAAILGEDS